MVKINIFQASFHFQGVTFSRRYFILPGVAHLLFLSHILAWFIIDRDSLLLTQINTLTVTTPPLFNKKYGFELAYF